MAEYRGCHRGAHENCGLTLRWRVGDGQDGECAQIFEPVSKDSGPVGKDLAYGAPVVHGVALEDPPPMPEELGRIARHRSG